MTNVNMQQQQIMVTSAAQEDICGYWCVSESKLIFALPLSFIPQKHTLSKIQLILDDMTWGAVAEVLKKQKSIKLQHAEAWDLGPSALCAE